MRRDRVNVNVYKKCRKYIERPEEKREVKRQRKACMGEIEKEEEERKE